MADDDTDGRKTERFGARWSRRKRAARATEAAAERGQPKEVPADEPGAPPAEAADPTAELPAIEDLDAGSDYTGFLDRKVPAVLRRQALRKLWRSSPGLANLDGLNDYDDDFASLGAGKLVRSAFEAGKALARKLAPETGRVDSPAPAEDDAAAKDEQPPVERDT